MIIQSKVEDKIQIVGERVGEKAQSINYLLVKDLVQILNCFIIKES